MADTPVTLAAITGAHGVAGEVRLKLFGEGLETLKQHRAFNDGALTLEKLRDDGKGGAIARFSGVADRTAAEALRGTELSVPRDALPPLAEDEFYYTDLVGLAARDESGRSIGTVIAVENFGATDIVEIERDPAPAKGPKTFMVPLTDAAVVGWGATHITISAAFAE